MQHLASWSMQTATSIMQFMACNCNGFSCTWVTRDMEWPRSYCMAHNSSNTRESQVELPLLLLFPVMVFQACCQSLAGPLRLLMWQGWILLCHCSSEGWDYVWRGFSTSCLTHLLEQYGQPPHWHLKCVGEYHAAVPLCPEAASSRMRSPSVTSLQVLLTVAAEQ